MLQSERHLYADQDLLAQSQASISTNVVALYKALGGGWSISPQALRTPSVSTLVGCPIEFAPAWSYVSLLFTRPVGVGGSLSFLDQSTKALELTAIKGIVSCQQDEF